MTPSRGAGRRRRARELALRVLFELEGSEKDAREVLAYQAAELDAPTDVRDFAQQLVTGCLQDAERIDAVVRESSRWSLGDLGKVERAVLRLGAYELLDAIDTPIPVVIDESCELARAYAGEEAVQYVNGVLGQVARERV